MCVPIFVRYINPENKQTVESFHCDLNNLITWLNTDPFSHEENITLSRDLSTIKQLQLELSQYPTLSSQLNHVYTQIASGKKSEHANPVAILINQFPSDCTETLLHLFKVPYMRQRFHDYDFLRTLKSLTQRHPSSFREYLSHNNQLYLLDVIKKAYVHHTKPSCPETTSIFLHDDSLLLKKLWPLNRKPLLSDEHKTEFSLDLELMKKIHTHSKAAISTTLASKAQDIQSQLNPDETYYIDADDELSFAKGNELTTSCLLELSLHKSTTVIDTIPAGNIPITGGLHLHTFSPPQSLPNGQETSQSVERDHELAQHTFANKSL